MTESIEFNPYAPPKSKFTGDIADKAPTTGLDEFPYRSTWLVLGLSIITLSFYMVYWMYSRTKILNRLTPSAPIADWIPALYISLLLVNFGFGLLEAFYGSYQEIVVVANVINLVSIVIYFIWIFKFRNRINDLSDASRGTKRWLGVVLTFFLSVVYFQFKLNRMRDEQV